MRLDKVVEEMDNGCGNKKPFNYKNTAQVKTSYYRAKIGYNFNDTCKSNIESIRSMRVQLIFCAHKITQTDDGPNYTYNDNANAN